MPRRSGRGRAHGRHAHMDAVPLHLTWCLACQKAHHISVYDVVRTCERYTDAHDGEGTSRVTSHVAQVAAAQLNSDDIELQLWTQQETHVTLGRAERCSTMGASPEQAVVARKQVACIMLHTACTLGVGSFDMPIAIAKAADACVDALLDGRPSHVALEGHCRSRQGDADEVTLTPASHGPNTAPTATANLNAKSSVAGIALGVNVVANVVVTPHQPAVAHAMHDESVAESAEGEGEGAHSDASEQGALEPTHEVSLGGPHSFFQAVKVGLFASHEHVIKSIEKGEDDARDVRMMLLSCVRENMDRYAASGMVRLEDAQLFKRAVEEFEGLTLVQALEHNNAGLPRTEGHERVMAVMCHVTFNVTLIVRVGDGVDARVMSATTPTIVVSRHDEGYTAVIYHGSSHGFTTPQPALDLARLIGNMGAVYKTLCRDEQLSSESKVEYQGMYRHWKDAFHEKHRLACNAWKMQQPPSVQRRGTNVKTVRIDDASSPGTPTPTGLVESSLRARVIVRGTPRSAHASADTLFTAAAEFNYKGAAKVRTSRHALAVLRAWGSRTGHKLLTTTPRRKGVSVKDWCAKVKALPHVKSATTELGRCSLPRATTTCVIARCAKIWYNDGTSDGCSFMHVLEAPTANELEDQDGTRWRTRLRQDHTCAQLERQSAQYLVPDLVTMLKDATAMSTLNEVTSLNKDGARTLLAAKITHQVAKRIAKQTLQRAAKKVREDRLGTVGTEIKCLFGLVASLNEAQNYARCTMSTRAHVTAVYKNTVKAHVQRQQKKQRATHARKVAQAVAGGADPPPPLAFESWDASKVKLPASMLTAGAYYYAWAYAPAHSIDMVRRGVLHPVSAVDGTHCTRVIEYGCGVFLLVYAQDHDKKQVLLLACHVLGNESTKSWAYCFFHLRMAYTQERDSSCMLEEQGYSVIADGMKGIDTAFKAEFGGPGASLAPELETMHDSEGQFEVTDIECYDKSVEPATSSSSSSDVWNVSFSDEHQRWFWCAFLSLACFVLNHHWQCRGLGAS